MKDRTGLCKEVQPRERTCSVYCAPLSLQGSKDGYSRSCFSRWPSCYTMLPASVTHWNPSVSSGISLPSVISDAHCPDLAFWISFLRHTHFSLAPSQVGSQSVLSLSRLKSREIAYSGPGSVFRFTLGGIVVFSAWFSDNEFSSDPGICVCSAPLIRDGKLWVQDTGNFCWLGLWTSICCCGSVGQLL